MLFSATMPPEIETLAKQFLTDPAHVKAPQTGITADKVTQRVTLMSEGDKRDRLCDILNEHDTGQSLIFVRTKRRADALAKFMEVRGFAVDALHGDMRQTLRQKVLRNFRSGQLRALIATDVAARGIDVAGLSHVINFDLTDTPEAYVHRIGRTGRAGLGGLALSFCAPDERNKLAAIIAAVGARVELYELDGTAVTDFKASGGAARGRRRPPQGARSRSQGDRSQGAQRDDRRDDRPRRDDRRDDRPRGDASDRRQDGRPSAGRPSAGRPSANSARTSKPFDGERRQSRPFAKWADADNRPQRDTSERRDNRPRRDASDRRDDRRDDWSKRDGFQKRDGFEKRDSRFKGRDDASGRDRPASGDQKPGRNTKPSFGEKPARGKKPFGSKPAFNKRPNFGDKSAAQKPASDRGKPADRAASPAPKSRKVGPPRRGKSATPQGGQGTLKRRR